MVSQARFELATIGLEIRCSIQLSYWDVKVLQCNRQCYLSFNIRTIISFFPWLIKIDTFALRAKSHILLPW